MQMTQIGMRDEQVLSLIARCSLIVVMFLSGVAAIGWVSGVLLLASLGQHFIPMAPSTALMFLLLIGSWFASKRGAARGSFWFLSFAGAAVEIMVSLIILLSFLTGTTSDIEMVLVPNPAEFGQVRIGRMSPITAAAFLLAGSSLLLLLNPVKRLASLGSVLGVAVSSIGFVVVVGYLFGAPVLYGSSIVPVALSTGIAFVLLGVGLSASAGPACWPFNRLTGSSVRARLLRPFLALTVIIILFYGWFSLHVPTANPALAASVVLFLSLAIVSVVVSRIAESIGDRIVRAEEALRRSVAETAAMVGHDLRNPLQGIAGAAQILEQRLGSSADEIVSQMLETLRKDVEYSNRIITDLVEFTGEIKFDISETSIRRVVEETLEFVKKPDNVAIHNLTGDNRILSDPEKIKRVLTNLFTNAFDAMPEGGELRISDRPVANGYEIIVSDSGRGIPAAIMEKLWNGFISTKAKGLGLGLAISKRIVEGLGGTISVKSRLGSGTQFTIWLPRKVEDRR